VGSKREKREGRQGTSCTCLIPDLMSRAEIEILRSVERSRLRQRLFLFRMLEWSLIFMVSLPRPYIYQKTIQICVV